MNGIYKLIDHEIWGGLVSDKPIRPMRCVMECYDFLRPGLLNFV